MPLFCRFGVFRTTEEPDVVVPPATEIEFVAPDVAVTVVPAVTLAFRVTLVAADRLIVVVAPVAPPTVTVPPAAVRASAPPELMAPVFRLFEFVVMETGLPVATMVPVIEFTFTETAAVLPLKLTVSLAVISPISKTG